MISLVFIVPLPHSALYYFMANAFVAWADQFTKD
jgi:hypothetical protein